MLSVNSSDAIDFSRPTYDVVAFYQADPVGGGAGKGLHVYNETDARYLLNILEGGNVGIGTTTPTAKLTVSGGVVINEEGYGYNDVRMEGDTDSALFFLDASADMVGIGTLTPTTKLEVVGTISGSALVGSDLRNCTIVTTSANGTLTCGTADMIDITEGDARYVNVSGDTMTGALAIKKRSGTGTGNTLIVDTKGLVYDATNKRVGIGTASPRTALEVLGAISGSSLSIRDSITGSGVLVIQGATTLKSTLAVTGNITTRADFTLNSDQGADDAILTFGSDTTNETLKFLNNEDRFEFSDDVRITGGTYASGALIVDGAAIFKSTVKLNGVTYTFPTSDGSASGRFFATNAAGQLSWTKGFTFFKQKTAYEMVQGDTMTGGLLINVGGA